MIFQELGITDFMIDKLTFDDRLEQIKELIRRNKMINSCSVKSNQKSVKNFKTNPTTNTNN